MFVVCVHVCMCVYPNSKSMLTFSGKMSCVFSAFDRMINEFTGTDRLNALDIFRKSFIIKYKQMLVFIYFTSIEITFRKLMRIQIDPMDIICFLSNRKNSLQMTFDISDAAAFSV